MIRWQVVEGVEGSLKPSALSSRVHDATAPQGCEFTAGVISGASRKLLSFGWKWEFNLPFFIMFKPEHNRGFRLFLLKKKHRSASARAHGPALGN